MFYKAVLETKLYADKNLVYFISSFSNLQIMSIEKRRKTPQELSAEGSVSETFKKALKSGSTWEDKVRQHLAK